MENPFILKVRNLQKSFNKKIVLKNISFEVKKGFVFSIVGPSGSGKSTLSKIILGLEKPDSGEILYKETPIKTLLRKNKKKFRKEIQIVLQNSASSFNPRHTIKNILREPFIFHKIEYSEEKIIEILKQVGLDESFLNRYPDEMSGGQRQRIAIARVLILKPELLILDEILRGLDISLQGQVIDLILKLKEEYGFSLIFISHNKKIVEFVSNEIFEIEN